MAEIMKPEEYPVEPPEGIFHFPQGVMCLQKIKDTGKEEVKIKRINTFHNNGGGMMVREWS